MRFINPLPQPASGLLIAALLAATPALHADTTRHYQIPAGTLDQTLNRYAAEAGLVLVINAELTRDKRSDGIEGSYQPEDGLRDLLRGSGLELYRQTNGSYALRKAGAGAGTATGIDAVPAADVRTLSEIKVTTAAGFEQTIAHAPASISVVTRETLEKQSYTSVVDALKNIPGVYVTGGGQMQDISVRGLTSTYTLYLVDGRPISAGRSVNTNGADGGKQIGLPPLASIERIEVIRGPASTLYGSEAMGGVINIITRKGGETWHGSVRAEYTLSQNDINNNAMTTEANVSGPLVKGLLGIKLTGSQTNIDESDFQGGSDSAASEPETKRRQGGVEFSLTPNAANTFTAGLTHATQETTATPGKSVATTTTGLPSTYRYDKDVYVLTHDGRYGNLMLNSYLQRDISDKVQTSDKKEKVSTFNTQGTYFWNQHVVTFGGQYKKEYFVNEENGLLGLAGGVRSAERWIGAVFSEVEWSLSRNLAVTTGLRYNDDQLFGGHLSPRIYGNYTLTPALTLKGGVSTGYRQPTIAQATPGFGSRTGGGGSPNTDVNTGASISRALIIGNADLKPETSTNYEAGLVFDTPAQGLDLSLMVFRTDFKDKLAEDRYCTSPGAANNNDVANYACPFGGNTYYFLSTTKNIDEARIQGIELAAAYDFTPSLRFNTSYTYTESEQRSGAFKGEPLNKQPKHMINALLDWQASEKLSAWLQGNYRGKTSDYLSRTTMSDGTPGYGFMDAGIMYRLSPSAKATAGLYNIADKEVTNDTYGVVLDGRRVSVGLTIDF